LTASTQNTRTRTIRGVIEVDQPITVVVDGVVTDLLRLHKAPDQEGEEEQNMS
jgi:hypothetical protein